MCTCSHVVYVVLSHSCTVCLVTLSDEAAPFSIFNKKRRLLQSIQQEEAGESGLDNDTANGSKAEITSESEGRADTVKDESDIIKDQADRTEAQLSVSEEQSSKEPEGVVSELEKQIDSVENRGQSALEGQTEECAIKIEDGKLEFCSEKHSR